MARGRPGQRVAATTTIALALALLLGCGKKDFTVEETRSPTEPRPCEVEAESLRTWLRDLATDDHVPSEFVLRKDDEFRYLGRPLPIVPLVHRDDPASPLMRAGILSLHRGNLRFGDDGAKISEPAGVAKVLKQLDGSSLSPYFATGGLGRVSEFHPVVLFIGTRERWADVVTLFDALTRAGYAQLEIAFEVKPRAAAPPSTASFRRMVEIESDPAEMPWKLDVAAAKELATRNPSCPDIAKPFAADAPDSTTMDAQLKTFLEETPRTLRACSCKADLDAIRGFAWVRFGRHWGPTTVSYEILPPVPSRLPDYADGGVPEIAATADAPWRDMADAVVEASKRKSAVRFVVR